MSYKNLSKTGYTVTFVGVIGLAIALIVNILGIYVFEKPSALFFADAWWPAWSPTYFLWLSLLIVGGALSIAAHSKKG